jgi:hypothetical protein
LVEDPDRTEYGDFQTNIHLASAVVNYLSATGVNPKYIVEPTCGKGHFIVAALTVFQKVEKIVAVEIYKPYIWETKFNILHFFLTHTKKPKAEIEINHCNVFDFPFKAYASKWTKGVLVLGNPPWVTNSKLGSLESNNLPTKSNFKNHSGFDAITGKGNFDIGEYITLMMFEAFHQLEGSLAFLVKNSVIKNLVQDQYQRSFRISNLEKLTIDSKKEFNVSVEASLFSCMLNREPSFACDEKDFYSPHNVKNQFGLFEGKFVSSILHYKRSQNIDGLCPFEWRQGIKHDLSTIMEFDRLNGHYVNGNSEAVEIERELVFGLLKSSDLKGGVISDTRKFTIVPQKKVGQSTNYIAQELPKTYAYLNKYRTLFDQRKSSIYNNKPAFSIFGIGDYSFAPFKVTISGLYKTYHFNLILPQNGKPIMVDDTCYLLAFDKVEFAAYSYILLNSQKSRELLESITFSDAKRKFTKDILMRIDLYSLAIETSVEDVEIQLSKLKSEYGLKVSAEKWNDYLHLMKPNLNLQLSLLERAEKYKKSKRKVMK